VEYEGAESVEDAWSQQPWTAERLDGCASWLRTKMKSEVGRHSEGLAY
jgi:hypothetical protein